MLLLEEIFKSRKNEFSEIYNLRIHRGLSWLKKANELDDDLELQFMSLWVALNAIHAQDSTQVENEQNLSQFIQSIFQKDIGAKINHLLWGKLHQPILQLFNNCYVYQEFWDYQNQKITALVCQQGLERKKHKLQTALENKLSVDILQGVFHGLYTLHHQLVQGGATYNSAVNRKQLQDSCRILSSLMPVFILLLLENAQSMDSKKPFYPLVQVC